MFGMLKKLWGVRTPGPPPLPAQRAAEINQAFEQFADGEIIPLEGAMAMLNVNGSAAHVFEAIHALSKAELFLLMREDDPTGTPLTLQTEDGPPVLIAFTQVRRAAVGQEKFPGFGFIVGVPATDILYRMNGQTGLLINPGEPVIRWGLVPEMVQTVKGVFADSNLIPATPSEVMVAGAKYRPGQVWAFEGDASEPDAVVTILQTDVLEQGKTCIVHIAVTGIRLPKGGTSISHMPFAEEALDRSVTDLLKAEGPVPDFKAGYDLWRWGRGGHFTVSVREAIDGVRKMDESR